MEKQTLKHQFYLYYSHSHSHCLVIKDETFSKRKMVENILQSPFHQLLLLLFSFSFHPLRDILLSLSHRQGSIILNFILLPLSKPYAIPLQRRHHLFHPPIFHLGPFQGSNLGPFVPAHFSPNLGLFGLPILGPFTPNPNTFVCTFMSIPTFVFVLFLFIFNYYFCFGFYSYFYLNKYIISYYKFIIALK